MVDSSTDNNVTIILCTMEGDRTMNKKVVIEYIKFAKYVIDNFPHIIELYQLERNIKITMEREE